MMKRFILFILACTLYLFQPILAQTYTILTKRYGSLVSSTSKEKINEPTLQQMLTQEDFMLYQQAHEKYNTAIPLWGVSGCCFGTGVTLLTLGIVSHFSHHADPETGGVSIGLLLYGTISSAFFAVAIGTLIPATIYTVNCNKKLDYITSKYNKQNSSMSFNVGLTTSGLGLTFKF